MAKQTISVPIKFDMDLYRKVSAVASRECRTIASLVRFVLTQYVGKK